jgi:acetoin utilization deacetylase AcuC-like enzyme
MELVSHSDFVRLHPTGDHPESTERLRVLQDRFDFREAEPAGEEDIRRCHSRGLVEFVRSIAQPTLVGLDTIASETTFEVALLAAGAAMKAVELSAFSLSRPPGHHATRDEAMGFCFFNNVAVAARYAQEAYGLERIAIVDWDVHHGNGTEAIFRGDDRFLYVSLHQWPFYPGTGGPEDQGETLVNVPLPAGSTDEEYLAAWDERVEPAVRRFDPEVVLVSAGFDAHDEDPIAQMLVTEAGFRELARRSGGLAPRVAAVLEGGYNVATLPRLVEAALAGFAQAK